MDQDEGEWWLLVETTATWSAARTAACGRSGHGRSKVQVRDLPSGGSPVRLVWRKRRWRCADPDCARQDVHRAERPGRGLAHPPGRARRSAGRSARTATPWPSWPGASGSAGRRPWPRCVDHGRPLVDDPGALHRVRTLGVDEHKMLGAGPKHHTVYATQLVDLAPWSAARRGPGRSAKSVADWLASAPATGVTTSTVVAIDPHRGYHNALVSRLPRATVTIDHFHAIKLANAAVDDVRRRVQRETTGHRGRKDDPLYGARRLMTRGWERLPDRQVARLFEALRQGDIYDEVGAAIVAQGAPPASCTRRESPRPHDGASTRFYAPRRDRRVPEVTRLARTIKRWEPEILTFFETGMHPTPAARP